MYRQFLIRKEDRKFQKILWIIDGVIKEFVLSTVTFGFAPSAFLAIRCIHQLAEDEGHRFPLAAFVLKNHLYVDNVLTGVDDIESGQKLCRQLIDIFKSARLNLRQWASNNAAILKDIGPEDIDRNYNLDKDFTLKTLGISWNASRDVLLYTIKHLPITVKFTKRIILSAIAKIFDPIGLLGPVIFYVKKLMQDIWSAKIEWDESVPLYILESWLKFCTQLNSIHSFSFIRLTFYGKLFIELHGFGDACEKGYGACIYIRTMVGKNKYSTHLLCSKSRVAPLKTRSVARLELCAALLLAELYKQVINALKIEFDRVYFWSDSSITLHWINTEPNLLKTFVANRVSEIQTLTDRKRWFHIPSDDNPADALSRGQLPLEFLENKLWLYGPNFLNMVETEWPKPLISLDFDNTETRMVRCLILQPCTTIFLKFSKYYLLKTTIAYCLRFLPKYRHFRNCKTLRLVELQNAEIIIIRATQKAAFEGIVKWLSEEIECSDNKLQSLDPFLDENGLLRVGGRIDEANIPFDARQFFLRIITLQI